MELSRFIFVALISFWWNIALAQRDSVTSLNRVTPNQLSFETGFSKGYLKDLNFSPLNYKENGTLVSLSYIRKRSEAKHIFTADLDYARGSVKSKATDFFTAQYIMGNIEFSFLWRLRQPKNRYLSFFLGPQYNTFIQYIDWRDQASWSYLAAHGLNIKGFCEYIVSGKDVFRHPCPFLFFNFLFALPIMDMTCTFRRTQKKF